MTIKPISPNEVQEVKNSKIPEGIIKIFNDLITKEWNGYMASFTLKEATKACEDAGIDMKEVYSNRWLDIEPLYRSLGWNVKWDKPGYNESYDSYWEFTKKK